MIPILILNRNVSKDKDFDSNMKVGIVFYCLICINNIWLGKCMCRLSICEVII